MDESGTHEVFDALQVLSRLGKVLTVQVDGKTKIYVEGCIIVGGGLSLPCEAAGDDANEAIFTLLWKLQGLPAEHYVMNAKWSRLRLADNTWSRIDRTKGE